MENRKINKIRITKEGFPLEQIIGRPITNFFRRLLLTDHLECRDCYYSRIAEKRSSGCCGTAIKK